MARPSAHGGEFGDVVPHLTIAEGNGDALDIAERLVLPGLPISTLVVQVDPIAFDGIREISAAHWRLGEQGLAQGVCGGIMKA